MPDQFGRRVLKVTPPGDSNRIEDVLDELYEVLYRRGYALMQGMTQSGSMIMVLARTESPGGKATPVAQIAELRPGKHIDWRAASEAIPTPAPLTSRGE